MAEGDNNNQSDQQKGYNARLRRSISPLDSKTKMNADSDDHRESDTYGGDRKSRNARHSQSNHKGEIFIDRNRRNSHWNKRADHRSRNFDWRGNESNSRSDRRDSDRQGNQSKSTYSDRAAGKDALEQRIAPREPKLTQSNIKDDEEEDEETRQRRIERLKRRRRSAGFDSDDETVTLEDLILARQKGRSEVNRNKSGRNRDEDVRRRDRDSNYANDDKKDARPKSQYESRADQYDDGRSNNKDRERSPRHRDGRRYTDRDRRRHDETTKRFKNHSGRGTVDSNDEILSDDDRRSNGRARSSRGNGDVKSIADRGDDRWLQRQRSPDARILARRRPSSSSQGREEDFYDHESGNNSQSAVLSNKRKNVTEDENVGWDEDNIITIQTPLVSRAGPDEVYERVTQVGEGTYGQVFKAKSDKTGIIVALKKIRMENEREGFPITALREVKLLQGLRHENVVQLHEMMLSKHSIYMVFEYLQHDLNGVLAQPSIIFSPAHVKSLASQLLAGLAYLHKHRILHRDLKCSNLLLNNEGTLKLADFGLARTYVKQSNRRSRKRTLDYTNRVVTLWYRAPELLFGETSYDDAIDIWGAGCIFLELFLRKPVIQGSDEIHQVHLLYDILGPVEGNEWPEAERLPWFDLVRPSHNNNAGSTQQMTHKDYFRKLLGPEEKVPTDALEVALALLTYNPNCRISAANSLSLPYFARNEPFAEKPAKLLQMVEGEWHEFESRKARRDAASQALQAHVQLERMSQKQPEQSQILSDKINSSTSTQEPVLDSTMSTIATPAVMNEDVLQGTNEKEASA